MSSVCALTLDFWCTMKILNPFNYRLHNRVSTGFGLEMCSAVGLASATNLRSEVALFDRKCS